MDVNLDTHESSIFFSQMVNIMGLTNNCIIFSYHIYQTLQFQKTRSDISAIEILSTFTIFSAIAFNLFSMAISFNIYPSFIPCELFMECICILYFVFKSFSYFLFLERLYAVFADTIYTFNLFTKCMSRILLSCYFAAICVMVFTTSFNIIPMTICSVQFPVIIYAILIFGDSFIGILISIICTRKLMAVGISNNSSTRSRISRCPSESTCTPTAETQPSPVIYPEVPDTPVASIPQQLPFDLFNRDRITWAVVNKFTLLTLISICSTFFTLMFCAIFGGLQLWMTVDTIINSGTVMLMFAAHHKIYTKLCLKIQNKIISIKCLSYYSCHYCCQIQSQIKQQAQISNRTPSSTMITIPEETENVAEKSEVGIKDKSEIVAANHVTPWQFHQRCSSLFDVIVITEEILEKCETTQMRESQVNKIVDVIGITNKSDIHPN
eukprot:547912_1